MQSGTSPANRLYYCYGLSSNSRDLSACKWGLKGNSEEKIVPGEKRDRGTFWARGGSARVAFNYELGFSTKKLDHNLCLVYMPEIIVKH